MTVERKRRPGTCERVVYARVLPLSKRDEENGPRKEVAKVEIVKKDTRRENERKTRMCQSYVQKESSISGGGCIYLSLSLCVSLLSSFFFLFLSVPLHRYSDLFRVKVSISLRQVFSRRVVCVVLVSQSNK